MEKFALEAMFLAGEHDAALERMLARFGPMIESPLSTLWEHWEADPVVRTPMPLAGGNHGWSGGALVLLSQYVAGLAPTSAGWSTFDVRPNLGSVLNNASASVATVHGQVDVAVQMVSNRTRMRVSLHVPAGTVAQLQFPASDSLGQVVKVTASPSLSKDAKDVSDGYAERKDLVTVHPGSWTFEARYQCVGCSQAITV